jgi:ribonuclease HII
MNFPLTLPSTDMLHFERDIWRRGVHHIAGVDEVGRGALAGPLVAAAVILPSCIEQDLRTPSFWHDVRDSKTLSAGTRERLALQIQQTAVCASIAVIPVSLLDAIGLTAANRNAMEHAVLGLDVEPELLLIDAMTLDLGHPQLGIIDGDALSLSIAAASIIAKVARDELMNELDFHFPVYGFARNKGYGVPAHAQALVSFGSCMHHRKSFAPVRRADEINRDR